MTLVRRAPTPVAVAARPAADPAPTLYTRMASPVGELLLSGSERALRRVSMSGQRWAPGPAGDWVAAERPFAAACAQLSEYFAADLRVFELSLEMVGTPFQLRVWEALQLIPYGQTRSYGEIAAAIGRPGAARAVGLANGRNPFAIVVPCHRVIGAASQLVGYGGGLERKRLLLDHEAGLMTLAAGARASSARYSSGVVYAPLRPPSTRKVDAVT